ncbi:PLP-dependent aminotransferase family protein [Mesorhizobium kowhaii]|uniref:aminotransferase-like domain-containing protein n=1 Tax=Mesorhizobium kowhaii TaxID=1300272 RepID=UPI0035E5536A
MLRPWSLQIQLRPQSQTPLYLQIVHSFIEEIRRGRIGAGTALPGTRTLSEQLAVSRKTIIAAYDELVAQGWATSDSTRGTFVSPDLPSLPRWTSRAAPSLGVLGGDGFSWKKAPQVIPWAERSENYLIFDDGTPDPRLAPVEIIARTYRRALVRTARRSELGYGDPRGAFALRQAISTMLNSERGLATTASNICLTRGSQMALYLCSVLLVRPGDYVAVEKLTYPPARTAFARTGASIVSVALDDGGIELDDLERACDEFPVKVIYLTPHHQFPTTVSMRPERRLRLLELSKRKGIVVVEDDYDHEFHFDHQPLLPLASASLDRTVYVGSLSKLISPSLRIGYLVSSPGFVDDVANEIMLIDRQGSQTMETAVAELMSEHISSYARKVHGIYKARRDHFATVLTTVFAQEMSFTIPAGGLAFWVQFKTPLALDELVAAAYRERLKILPSDNFSSDGEAPYALRLGYASMNEGELTEAVQRLHRAYKSVKR